MLSIFFSAFSSSPLNTRCFPPSAPDVQDFQASFLKTNIDDRDGNFMVVAESGSRVVGWARWVRKETPSSSGKTIDASAYPASGDRALAAHFFQVNADATAEHVAGERHWFLSTIVTDQEVQRRGVGSVLMKFGVERADEEGWMAYVNSSVAGRGLYEKFGFRVVGTSEFPELRMVQYHMKREVRH
ncbi:hypothetical protein F66182_5516 [Fusarium sp. NRRL 66182]|nr:hypothetical protein F66182_5516 [Fusarium sp. NRRL 66182]